MGSFDKLANRNKSISAIIVSVVLSVMLSSCTTLRGPIPNDPMFAPVYPTQLPAAVPSPGAIYNPSTAQFLLEDNKAKRVGDILMVQLVESTNATKKADTSLTKDDEINIPEPSLFGNLSNITRGLGQDITPEREFTGEADSNQSNQLSGNITVTVMQVLPNGYMSIRGEKWITLNQGREYIRLSGIVRPQDITSDNQVASNRLGNARIEYSGTGALAATNSQGWLSRFFSSGLWPF